MRNTYPKYLNNKPSGKDLFEGKSQERISKNIAEQIKEPNNIHRIIGIEGEWGSGKSNIIELLKNQLKQTHYIYIYDTWGHQEDSQRRAFLEELTEELIQEKILSNKTKYKDIFGKEHNITWKEKIKYLLARKRETNKKTIPKLSVGIIIIGLILIFTPILSLVSNIIFDKNTEWWKKLLLPISPILLAVLIYLIKSLINFKLINLSEIFFIYKGKELENTTYEIFSELEPSVKEFKDWIDSISKGLTKDLVIVYDNMDRLPPEKVKGIWSSIHTFFAEKTYDKINIIIPFDKKHLQIAFGDDECQTNEFINKTFSIVYRVSPPVLTDWKEFFAIKFKEAFGESENKEFPIVLSIFDRLRKKFTPRDIIIFINELVTQKKIWKEKIPLRYIAVFSLKKDAILKEPIKNILNNSYLGSADNLFSEDTDLPNYISALTFNVPVEKATQILLIRDLELTLRNEGSVSIEELSKHPNFIDILEEVIKSDSIYIERAVPILDKLNYKELKNESLKKRFEKIWDALVSKQCSRTIPKFEFEDKFKILLSNSSKGSQQQLLKCFIKEYNIKDTIEGKDYFESLNNLEIFLNENKIEFNISNYLQNRVVEPNVFLKYLNSASKYYKKYKVSTSPDKLDEFITSKLPDELETLPTLSKLKFIIDEYSLPITQKNIEKLISDEKLSINNFSFILELYKAISKEKPLKEKIKIKNLFELLNKTNINDKGYSDLIAIRLSYGNEYYNEIRRRRLSNNDNTSNILSNINTIDISEIANYIEFYITYGELLMLSTTWTPLLLKAILRELINNKDKDQKLCIVDILQKFDTIISNLEIEPESLLKSLDKWTAIAKEKINKENIFTIISNYSFFEFSSTLSLELTNYLNKTIIEYLDEVNEEALIKDWGNNSSYAYNILNIFLNSGHINPLPNNIFKSIKTILINISKLEIDIPDPDSIWSNFIEKAKVNEITPTIKNIRDYFVRENNISPGLFIFFESFFRKYGDINDISADFVRTILSRIISNDDCFDLIIKEKDFYIPIINNAKEDASDLKENIRTRLNANQTDKSLIEFAKEINVKIEEKNK